MAASVTVSWTYSHECTGFRVFRKVQGQPGYPLTPETEVPSTVFSFHDASVSYSSTYLYKVVAYNQAGNSIPVETTITVTVPAPEPVDTLTAIVIP